MSEEVKAVTERVWTTVAGLKAVCLLVHGSHRCGYVAVPEGHPLHGVSYSADTPVLSGESPEMRFDVHGGITFSGFADDGYPAPDSGGHKLFWYGFDCAHSGDGLMGRLRDLSSGCPVRSADYVVAECEKLAAQLAEFSDWEAPDPIEEVLGAEQSAIVFDPDGSHTLYISRALAEKAERESLAAASEGMHMLGLCAVLLNDERLQQIVMARMLELARQVDEREIH